LKPAAADAMLGGASMPAALHAVFTRLRALLEAHAGDFHVACDTDGRYGLEGPVGPATVRAWGGKARTSTIPVAWVAIGKTYVSYHLMGVQGNARLMDTVSDGLRAHMQGKSCFNFNTVDEALFQELARVTAESLHGMKKAGYVAARLKETI
jgi:hypothetical protein